LILPHPEGVVIASYTVLVADNVHPSALDVLASTPEIEILMPDTQTRDAVLAKIAEADGLLIRSATKVDREMFEAAPRLRAIGRAGVGVDNVDLGEATARGVAVMNTPDGNTVATAEYAFGLLLAMLRQIPQAHQSMTEGRWDRKSFMGMELRGKTMGIIGLGRIGRAVARRAMAFEMNVIAFDAYDTAREIARAEGLGVDLVPLDELLGKADIITLHPSLEDTTRGMINKDTLGKMKRGVYLVNAARGALIVDADLAEALKSGQVAGAALDVYAEEPPKPDNPLLSAPNVLHTPHLAASTEDAQITVAVDAAKLLVRGLIENEYRNVVNPLAFEQRA
jgi:D-3-phosphoglycerate dehydrogenase / 2-oxoglutarate reductase